MRWRIRSQLLLPVVLLLAGVAGISITTAIAATHQARRQIETRLRTVARFLDEGESFPLTEPVLRMLRPLSGAEFLLEMRSGDTLTSLELDNESSRVRQERGSDGALPAFLANAATLGPVAEDWQTLHLGPPVRIHGETYLCSGLRLKRWRNQGDTLYILYPESLWRDVRWEAIWPSLVLGVSLGAASLALVLAQAQQLSRRIQELDRQTRLIAGGDFSPMPLPARDDEIRDLTRSVNEMADRLAKFQETVQSTERLRLLGQVSGGLAHQLRNGLTGARLAVQLFLREAPAGADTSALEVALRQLTLLETHVKRFLDLGRTGPSRLGTCDLRTVIGEAVELLRPQCRHAGIELLWQPPESPLPLTGDAGQLGQLVVNLLGNAIDAAGPGGSVEIRLQIADCRLQIDKTKQTVIVLEVLDTGPGPPEEVAGRLFEPFVTSKPEGVGLGLAVARQVAEGHGGRIDWLRREGRTCFRVELPTGTG
jgi:signal transduction histidine kinase